jgi:hypothetical protein
MQLMIKDETCLLLSTRVHERLGVRGVQSRSHVASTSINGHWNVGSAERRMNW